MDVRVGLWRKQSAEELNCGIGEDSESPLDCKEIQPVHPKGDQSWVFIGRNDAEAETPVLWPPHVKSRLIGKDTDSGRDWGQEEKGTTEGEMAGWHHRLNAHEFGWTLGVSDGQGGLACCDSWGHKESDTTENMYNLKFAILSTFNYVTQGLTQCCTVSTTVCSPQLLVTPKQKLYQAVMLPSLPLLSPWQPLMCFLSV